MKRFLLIGLLCSLSVPVWAMGEGMIRVQSAFSVAETLDRLQSVLAQKGFTVFARVDHRAGGEKVDLTIADTEVLIFGNPKAGTRLMQCAPSVAIDLPMKALAWQDQAGQVWLAYNAPDYLQQRHNIQGCDQVLKKMQKGLRKLTAKAVTP
ncbi:DUF302 domain-containing protein [Hydrogenovibrio halophilus]|uniref:DUF302 domain-containing protein n=1 Tax=Hydrogenovibrio halophilus TaxID=373391 RepID=UPI0003781C53|nr:DUF302 domain-containing protein [Hydrogenovibrio halophilus]